MLASGTVEMQKKFVADINKFKPKHVGDQVLERYKTHSKTSSKKDKGEWMSYYAVATRDGEDLTNELMASGVLQARTIEGLGPYSKLKYPWNQEVAYTRKTWSKGETAEEVFQQREELPDDDEAAANDKAAFEEHFNRVRSEAAFLALQLRDVAGPGREAGPGPAALADAPRRARG